MSSPGDPVNRLVSDLASVVRAHVTDNKILLAPSFADASSLLEELALSGTPWLNIRPATAGTLASNFAKLRLGRLGLKEVGDVTGLLLAEEAMAAVSLTAAPNPIGEAVQPGLGVPRGYFTRVPRTPGVVQAVLSAIMDVRLAGLTSSDLTPEYFVDPTKGREFIDLVRAYEEGLTQRGFADRADVLQMALEEVRAGSYLMLEKNLFLIPSTLTLRGMEFRLVEEITRGRRIILRQDPVVGVGALSVWSEAGDRPSEDPADHYAPRPLSWLMAPADAPASASPPIDIFHASSPYNEVREVLRRILASGAPFDHVALITSDTDLYHRIIQGVTRKLGVPTTFAEGQPILGTRPGRALAALLRWIMKDWGADTLRRALAAGDIALTKTEDAPSGMAMARALRGLGIGWGRGRYLPALENAIHDQEDRRAGPALGIDIGRGELDEVASHSTTAIRRNLSALKALRSGIANLLEALPVPDESGTVDMVELLAGLAAAVERYAVTISAEDVAAQQLIPKHLKEAAGVAAGRFSLAEAAERVRCLVSGLRVGASGPKPGHLHVAGYRCAGWTLRRQAFLLGLDEGRFPGAGLQNPVLLDDERRQINAAKGTDLPLATDRVRQNSYDLAHLVAALPGRVTFSFASHEPIEEKSVFPASVLLQAFRLREGKPKADYSELLQALGRPIGYVPKVQTGASVSSLDAHDWWLSHLVERDGTCGQDRLVHVESDVRRLYSGLDRGLIAADGRDSDKVTPYDGQIKADPTLDPRKNPNLMLSPSAIEKLATCPFAYFLHYVLDVEPPEDLEYDPTRWLDPLQKGTLLHEIFRQFLEDLKARGQARPRESDRAQILQIAGNAAQKHRDEVPPPSEAVYESDCRDLLRSAQTFFNMEMAAEVTAMPRYFELDFGFGDKAPATSRPEHADPVTIQTGSGQSIKLRGRIDRVDEVEPHHYQIWDYKTGSSIKYEDHEYLKRGRQAQHALYATAMEEILRATEPEAEVDSAGYLFPTEKGEGRRLVRQRDRRDRLQEVLCDLFDLVGEGTFVAAEDGYGCNLCDYAKVCGGKVAAERTKMKLERADGHLEPLRRLQRHE